MAWHRQEQAFENIKHCKHPITTFIPLILPPIVIESNGAFPGPGNLPYPSGFLSFSVHLPYAVLLELFCMSTMAPGLVVDAVETNGSVGEHMTFSGEERKPQLTHQQVLTLDCYPRVKLKKHTGHQTLVSDYSNWSCNVPVSA